MTAHLSNNGSHWNDSDRYEPRPTEELLSRTDCIEEILFEVVHTMTAVRVIEDVTHIRSQRGRLYDRVEEIVQRAEAIALQGSSDSQPQSE